MEVVSYVRTHERRASHARAHETGADESEHGAACEPQHLALRVGEEPGDGGLQEKWSVEEWSVQKREEMVGRGRALEGVGNGATSCVFVSRGFVRPKHEV